MNIKIITASAGSGKTTRLSTLLDEAIGAGRVSPERIVATTFTKQAAAELVERARGRLLTSGRGDAAQRLLAARIGTVNSVCGGFVSDFAFELGLSPTVRVLDETAADIELNRALASVVPMAMADRLQWFASRFDLKFRWDMEARKLVQAARANGLGADAVRACAARSKASLDNCLGPCEPDGDAIARDLRDAIDGAIAAIDLATDTTDGTRDYVELLRMCREQVERSRLRWGDWAKLLTKKPCKKSVVHAAPVQAAAAQHKAHPGLRAEMHELIDLLFEVAARGIDAYETHKRDRGIIDYVDQETLTLQLLGRTEVVDALRGQIDLVLVDEFQDTSPIQLAIFLRLAKLARESVWVGDPKQAIYGFRGTDPKLMDAAIEALTSESNDPELVQQAVDAVADSQRLETLSVSYRSRPELVHLTSDIFAPAFASQGMPEERTRLMPHDEEEPPDLGPVLEHWPLTPANRKNEALAACAATGVAQLLARGSQVRDGRGRVRPATAGDVGVLCRTNAQCQQVADALDSVGIAAVVPRVALFDSAEARLVHAGLRLWLDPRDSLAAAEIARLLSYAERGDDFVARTLERPGPEAFADEPAVVACLAARADSLDAPLLELLDRVMVATSVRRLAAAWGNGAQRLANLDALRGHAEAYVAEARANRHAPTLAGFLAYVDGLVDDSSWYQGRNDAQAVRDAVAAVTVSTWHRAKGLEWPITVLFGLESLRSPDCYGVRVASDRDTFSVDEPLAGRWIRFWPNPYTTGNQRGPVKDAYEDSTTFADIKGRADREALRVLYVGWTRARDRLILAAKKGQLLNGLLGKLHKIDSALIDEPTAVAGEIVPGWAGRDTKVLVVPTAGAAPTSGPVVPGSVIDGIEPRPNYPPADRIASAAAPVPCQVGEIVELGAPIALRDSTVNLRHLGDAVHGFLAVDRVELQREQRFELAQRSLAGYRVESALRPEELVEMSDRLWTWIGGVYAGYQPAREAPVAARRADGSLLRGAADLVLVGTTDFVVVDHKASAQAETRLGERAKTYSGQLAAYARCLESATARSLAWAWIHFPLAGRAVSVRFD